MESQNHAPLGGAAAVSAEEVAAYGNSFKIEPYGTEAVPDHERHGHPRHQFTLWFAANMVLAVLVTGFFSASFGLTVVQGLTAVGVGSLVGAVLMGILAGAGTRLGVPQQIQARGPMGYLGNFLPITLLTIMSAIGWTAVNTVFAVIALQTLVPVPFWLASGIIFLIQAGLAVWGHNIVHAVNKVATVVLIILFGMISVFSLGKADLVNTMNEQAPYYMGPVAGWVTFAGFALAYVLTWTPFASDFSRYLPKSASHTSVAVYTAAGSFAALFWLESIGVLVSSFAGELGAVEALAELTGPLAPIAMATIVLSTFPVSAMNLYGGALSLLTIHIPVSRVMGVLVVATIGFLITLVMQTDPYGAFYDFLSVLAYLVCPFVTILLLDYYLVRRRQGMARAVTDLYDSSRTIRPGFVAWILACVISSLFWNATLWTGPLYRTFSAVGDVSYLVGAAAAIILYLILARPFSTTRTDVPTVQEKLS